MADKALPCPTVLRLLLRYDAETGALTWLTRPHCFVSAGGKHTAKGRAAIWNATWAGKPALTANDAGGYLVGLLFGRRLIAHRAAWAIYYGRWPKSDLDHINGNRADNRIANLREASRQENSWNRGAWKRAASKYRGVYAMPNGRWRARINDKAGKTLSLGVFASERDAAMAFNAAAAQLHGHWARLNEV